MSNLHNNNSNNNINNENDSNIGISNPNPNPSPNPSPNPNPNPSSNSGEEEVLTTRTNNDRRAVADGSTGLIPNGLLSSPSRLSNDDISSVVQAVLQSLSPQISTTRSLSRDFERAAEIKRPPTFSGGETLSSINFKPPPGLPEFKQGESEPARFFTNLEQMLRDVQIPSQFWRLALLSATHKDKAAASFVRLEMANTPWQELKIKFVERFKLQPLALHVTLHAMRQGAETVDAYFDRFSEVAQQLLSPEGTPHIIATFIQSLHPALRQPTLMSFRAKLMTQPAELSVAFVAAKEVETQLSFGDRARYQASKRGHHRGIKRSLHSNVNSPPQRPQWRKKARPDYPPRDNQMENKESSLPSGRPFRGRGSGRGFGRGRGKPQTFQTDRVEIVDNKDEPLEHEESESSTEQRVRKVTQEKAPKEKAIPRHPVPAELNDRKIVFKYDIGADRSIVSKDWCDNNGITVLPTTALAQSFHSLSAPTPLLGEFTARIRIQGTELEHKFYVDHLFVDGLFGEDLAVKTSLVPLLPLSFPSQSGSASEDSKLLAPSQIVGEVFEEKEVASVMSQLKDALAANSSIPQTSFCNLSFAEVSVDLQDEEPIYSAQYPIPGHLEEAFAKVIADWIARHRIEPSTSSYNSPVTVVLRRVGDKIRICLDFRRLNAKLRSIRWATPIISEVLNALAGKRFYAEFDLKEAYLQLPVRKKDRHKLAFTVKIAGVTQRFQFRGAPFGLWHLPGHFQETMTRLFFDLPFVVIYLDNIVVASDDLQEHTRQCKQVIERLTTAGLRLNADKVKVARKVAAILGHLLDQTGIGPDPARLQALKDYPTPKTAKELERYVGALVFIRPFLPNAHKLLQYLHEIKGNKQSFRARDVQKYEQAIAEVKEGLNNVIRARPFIAGKPLGIATDASRSGIAAVLFYVTADQPVPTQHNIVAMAARGLLSYEKSYPIYQLELLAIVFAVNKFHLYVFGSSIPIQVLTDHSALVEIMSNEPIKQTIARWLFQLMQYNLVFKHIKGKSNTLPDILSRAEFPSPEIVKVNLVRFSDELKFFLHDRQLVPPENRQEILNQVHNEGHFAREQMMKKLVLERQVYWPKMAQDVARRVRQCAACMKHNVAKWGYHPRRTATAEFPMQSLQIDVMELPKCNDYVAVLVIICVFSGFLFLRPLKSKTAQACAEAFLDIVWLFGPPLQITSDNASDFINALWSKLLSFLGVEQKLIPAYYPLPKGRVERAIGAIRVTLRKYLEGDTNWVSKLGLVQFRLNSLIAAATKSSPFALMFGRSSSFSTHNEEEKLDWSALQIELTSIVHPTLADTAKTHRQVKLNKKFRQPSLTPLTAGDQVMLKDNRRTDKMDQVATGPYTVVLPLKHDQYVIKDATGTAQALVVPRSHLRRSELKQDEVFEVESILDSAPQDNTTSYLVKWKGYEEPTWILREDFMDEALIRVFEAKNTKTNLPAKVHQMDNRKGKRSQRK